MIKKLSNFLKQKWELYQYKRTHSGIIPFSCIDDSPGGTTSLNILKLACHPEGKEIIKELGEKFDTHKKFKSVRIVVEEDK